VFHHFDKLAVEKISWFSDEYGHAALTNKAYPWDPKPKEVLGDFGEKFGKKEYAI